jgi:drug/metabolite transporter (DMT)-like permease
MSLSIDRLFRTVSANSNARALAIMFVSTIAFSLMHACVRHLSGELHPFEIAFFRNAFGFLVILPWFLRYGTTILSTNRLGLHSVRAGLNVIAMLCFFFALSVTPLSTVAALSFTAPIFATVLAIVLLGEKVRLRRWIAIAIGFAGTFIAIRPGFAEVGLGSILVLIQSVAWAAALITIKVLGRTESSITIAAYMVLLMTPLSFVPALFYWQAPTLEQLVWLLAIGVLGTVGQLLMTQSLKEGDTTVVMPIDFFKLIWASALGYWIFAEVPDRFTWFGGMMIFASTAYIAYRESQLRANTKLQKE